jgi:hypothetical protein
MLTIQLTFSQQLGVFTLLSESETVSMINCPSFMKSNISDEKCKIGCISDEILHTENCEASCALMITILYFNLNVPSVYQHELQLAYHITDSAAPYYLPQPLYRPPLVS